MVSVVCVSHAGRVMVEVTGESYWVTTEKEVGISSGIRELVHLE